MRWWWVAAVAGCTGPTTDATVDEPETPIEEYDPLDWVDPFVATGGVGAEISSVSPGATLPFGMTLVGPDTRSRFGQLPFYHCAGYYYEDTHIDGISHTHAHGMGVVDYGAIAMLPLAHWDPTFTEQKVRSAAFDHEQESASPGRYQVVLTDDGTDIDIVATTRGAHWRVTFADTTEPVLIVDLAQIIDTESVAWGELDIDLSAGTIDGFQNLKGSYSGRFGGLQTSFAARLDPAPVAGGTWTDKAAPQEGVWSAEGEIAGAWLVFPEGTETVNVRVALSYTDRDGAWANLDAELPDLDFDARVTEAETAWRDLLGTARVRGSDDDKTLFHTAQYHAMLMPSINQDVDGRYRTHVDTIGTVDFNYYSDFSLWDTFRTQHSWILWLHPQIQADMNRSLIRMTEDGGSLPRWPLAHGYTGGMVGTPAQQVLAESHLKGLEGWGSADFFDKAMAASVGPQADAGRGGVQAYVDQGYVTWESAGSPAALTLEYAWSDASMALWAASLGRDEDAATLSGLAGNWANTYDPDFGFFVGRYADGSFSEIASPVNWVDDFVEGNAWHYLWMVPHDVAGMIEVQHGGDVDAFEARYAEFWDDVYAEDDDIVPDDYYWHGNEPDIHYAFLGALADRHTLTAEASRWVTANRYHLDSNGLDGNDDAGTLSAWYLFSAVGLFPVAGTTTWAVGSPIFDRVELDVAGGTFVIRAPGTSAEAMYVHGVSIDGDPLDASHVDHAEVANASELVFEMSQSRGSWVE